MQQPKRHKKLRTRKGFDELLQSEAAYYQTNRQAFKQLHREAIIVFDSCPFDDFKQWQKEAGYSIKK